MLTGMFATIEGTEELTTGTNDTPFSQCVHIVIVRIVNSIILKVGNTLLIIETIRTVRTTNNPKIIQIGRLDNNCIRGLFLDLLSGISTIDYPYLASNFFVFFITLVCLGAAAACLYRIDFPLLFIITFPVFELGMYWGWEPSMWTVIGLFICWVTVLALHIINHTTNKAGRKNTFAVHERKRTFYFTSEYKLVYDEFA